VRSADLRPAVVQPARLRRRRRPLLHRRPEIPLLLTRAPDRARLPRPSARVAGPLFFAADAASQLSIRLRSATTCNTSPAASVNLRQRFRAEQTVAAPGT